MRAFLAVVMIGLGLGGLSLRAPAQEAEAQTRGRALFTAKECARCHRPRGEAGVGPALDELRRPQGAFVLAGRLWNHAPAMFTALTQEGVKWPEINPEEMVELMAYLEAIPARDPTPDLSRGETMLVRKGCLKCHSLRGEGARIGPDLSGLRSAYESGPGWASRMWKHTPRMAAVALERGILYPRFTDGEMGDLLGYLRSVAEPSR
jgi:mono/diheme cytochrome c family protein